MDDLVELARTKIIKMGGSQYILVPLNIRQQCRTEFGDDAVILRSAETNVLVLRFEKTGAQEHPNVESNGVRSE